MRRLLALLPVSLFLAACGGSSSTSVGGGQAEQTIQISEEGVRAHPVHR